MQAQSRAKRKLQQQGIQVRKDKKDRIRFIKDQTALEVPIPPEMLIPIRDREKEQSIIEAEEVLISLQLLVDMVAKEQRI